MKLTQISVFLENRKGRLATVSHTLADANINILALSLADTCDFGILRLIVEDEDKAINVLREKGFTIAETSVVAIHVPDYAGSMSAILDFMDEHVLNIEYMYAMADPLNGGNALVFRVEDVDTAIVDLIENGHILLPHTLTCKEAK